MHADQIAAVNAKLSQAPAMSFLPGADETWAIFKDIIDADGQQAMEFAERWARLMQLEMASGKSLADIAEATREEADFDELLAPQMSFVMTFLCRYWSHNEELIQWRKAERAKRLS